MNTYLISPQAGLLGDAPLTILNANLPERGCAISLTLITRDGLIDALVWKRFRAADGTTSDLLIDTDTLYTCVQNLTEKERGYIDTELRRRSPWTN
ncbi:hypothetical protein O4214_05205 [Rhodococcus erythropolis]|uniref:hypothetical protein n=1 Tax=Rhodococcus erythropolis TaxID=1833 RepID=UPI001E2C4871|nr:MULTISPECIES: hypothetical protein [Rhodococcus erythropolis group]MCD2104315.1 hypothetical protein [Rhodococcus qingshengii]MCZ4523370.1 hypothetical protein [Rhodococcus erythropolis]